MSKENNSYYPADPWGLAERAIKKRKRVFLYGPPGVGKSYLASREGQPLSITLSEDLTVQELMGHWVPKGTEFKFHYGPITTAFKEGLDLVLNEIGRASGSVHDFLLVILDGTEVARLTLPSGETVRPGPGFKVIATSNTPLADLGPALRSRFQAEVHLRSPHPELIKKLDRCYPGLGRAVADSFKDPERALDPRHVLSFVEMLDEGFTLQDAALLAFGESGPDVLAALSAAGVRFPCDRS
ncbi:MAG: AAA family ATPase [Bryobacteraceae bacterium]